VSALAPLRHAPFRLLLAGRVVSALGNAVAPIALAFAVLDLTGSPRDLGLVVGIRTLCNVLFVLFGGVLADRLPRHLLMVGTSVGAGLTQAAIAVTVLNGTATIAVLIGLSAINGMFAALAMPATAALLPQTVPADERQSANALSRMFYNGTMIMGAAAGGVLVAAVGPGWGIAVDATTFLVAAACFALVRVAVPAETPARAETRAPAETAARAETRAPTETAARAETRASSETPAQAETRAPAAIPGPAEEVPGSETTEILAGQAPVAAPARASVIADLRTGWSEFTARTWLWVVVAGFAVINACLSGGLYVLGPVVADDTIGRRAWGFVLAAQTVGMIVGGLLAIRLRMRRMLYFGVICTGAIVLPVLALGVAPMLGVLVAAAFVAGLGIEQFGVAWETTMQEHVPADKLARVYSYDMLGSFVAMPVGEVIAGPVGQAVGAEPALVGAAALIGAAVLGMLASRDVRTLRHRVPSRQPGAMEELAA
jgi:MFS family permease